ncbi:MAG: helix-turn-helix domain-containing protein [Archangium sp.]
MRETARELQVSARRLQQLFDAELGLSPRYWRRLTRVHRAVEQLHDERLSRLALTHGFTDQSHLTNEFRALLGMTPTQLISQTSKTVVPRATTSRA